MLVAVREATLAEVANAAERLFDCRQPRLPEDLAFLRADGSIVLATIAHERDAWLELTQAEFDTLARDTPDIAALLRGRS